MCGTRRSFASLISARCAIPKHHREPKIQARIHGRLLYYQKLLFARWYLWLNICIHIFYILLFSAQSSRARVNRCFGPVRSVLLWSLYYLMLVFNLQFQSTHACQLISRGENVINIYVCTSVDKSGSDSNIYVRIKTSNVF